MSAGACKAPLSAAELIEYWLDGAAGDVGEKLEEHLFACGECSGRLAQIVALGDAVNRIVRCGGVGAVLTGPFVERLKRRGVRVREYRMGPSEQVSCTITPEDDLVVAHLGAALAGVRRVDLLVHEPGSEQVARLEDVPFDPGAGEIALAARSAYLRGLGGVVQRVEVAAVEDTGDRLLGVYTFKHTPHAG